MADFVSFGTYDPEADVDIDRRCLPHWFQPGVATFITFRTADSMPKEVVDKWKAEVRGWLTRYGIMLSAEERLPTVEQLKLWIGKEEYRRGASSHIGNTDGGASSHIGNTDGGASSHIESGRIVGEYFKLRNALWHGYLDECHGACVLRSRELAAIVLDSLKYFDGERYDLDSAIIMPNHVHLIAQFRPPVTCRTQCESWLHYTAYQINKCIGSKGAFWQSEPFDHLIRSEEQFHYLRNYIAQNGTVARLPEGNYLYWSRQ